MRFVALACAAILGTSAWATSLVYDAYVPTTATTVFEGVQLSEIGTKYLLAATMGGGSIDNPGAATVCNRDAFTGVVRYEIQKIDGYWLKCVIVELTQDGDNIKAVATNARYIAASNGIGYRFQESGENGTYNGNDGWPSATPVTSATADGYGISGLALTPKCDFEYTATQGSSPTGWITSFGTYNEPFSNSFRMGPDANLPYVYQVVSGQHPWNGLDAKSAAFSCAVYADVSRMESNMGVIFAFGQTSNMIVLYRQNDSVKAAHYNGNFDKGWAAGVKIPGSGFHLYTVTYDPTTGVLALYLDDGQIAATNKDSDYVCTTGALAAGFQIGSIYAGTGSFNKGIGLALAKIMGYDSALNAADVAAISKECPAGIVGEATEAKTFTNGQSLSIYDNATLSGAITLNSGSTLNVNGGTTRLTSGERKINGTVNIAAGATLVNVAPAGDAVDYNGGATVNVYGTLDMGATRWTIGGSNTIKVYNGGAISGTGQPGNGSTLDMNVSGGSTIQSSKVGSEETGTATIDAPIRSSGGANGKIVVDEGMTLICSGRIYGAYAIKKQGAGTLVLAYEGSESYKYPVLDSEVEDAGDINLAVYNAGDARDLSTVSTNYGLTDDCKLYVNQSKLEYAFGSDVVVENIDSLNPNLTKIYVNKCDGTVAEVAVENGTATLPGDSNLKIDGGATVYDATFTNTCAFAYKQTSTSEIRIDNGRDEEYNNEANDKSTGLLIKGSPYIVTAGSNTLNDLPSFQSEMTMVVVGTMPTVANTIFVHLGYSRDNNNQSDKGLVLATTANANEVIVSYNVGQTVKKITTMTVPNASTARHVYAITKKDDTNANQTTFTVYLDGIKWKTVVTSLMNITAGGVQIGADFGGGFRGTEQTNDDGTKSTYQMVAANDNSGILNALRLYDMVLPESMIKAYSEAEEYPYVSPKGSSSRAFDTAQANWVEESNVWANTEGDEMTYAGAPTLGAALTVDADSATAVNVNLEGVTEYEALTVNGPITFEASGAGVVKVTGASTIGAATTIKNGAVDIGGAPVTITEDGYLTFDYSTYVAASAAVAERINLTGEIDATYKVSILNPAPTQYFFYSSGYDTQLKQYYLDPIHVTHTVTLPSVVGATPVVTANGTPVVGENNVYTVNAGSTVEIVWQADGDYFVSGSQTLTDVTSDVQSGSIELPTVTAAVAKIGTDLYETLAEAIAAAKESGETVLLLVDHPTGMAEPFVLSDPVTVDTNGHLVNTPTVTVANGFIIGTAPIGSDLSFIGDETWIVETLEEVDSFTRRVKFGYGERRTVKMDYLSGDGNVVVTTGDLVRRVPDDDAAAMGGPLGVYFYVKDSAYLSFTVTPYGDRLVSSATIKVGEAAPVELDPPVDGVYTATVTGDAVISVIFGRTFMVEVPDNTTISVQGATLVEGNTYKAPIGATVTITYTAVGNYVVTGGTKEISITGTTETTITAPDGMTISPAVAQIDTILYATLQAAVDAATQNKDVVLLATVEEGATVAREVTFNIVPGEYTYGDIAAGGDYILTTTALEGKTRYSVAPAVIAVTINDVRTLYSMINAPSGIEAANAGPIGTTIEILSGDPQVYVDYLPMFDLNTDTGVFTKVANPVAAVYNGVIQVQVYRTLAAAIEAAQEGQKVVLLAATDEDVTVDKVVVVEAGAYEITGTITVSADGATVTLLNEPVLGENTWILGRDTETGVITVGYGLTCQLTIVCSNSGDVTPTGVGVREVLTPNTWEVRGGTEVTLTATPGTDYSGNEYRVDSGYYNVTGGVQHEDLVFVNNVATITAAGDTYVSVTFVIREQEFTIPEIEHLTVTSVYKWGDPETVYTPVAGKYSITQGTIIVIRYTPEEGYMVTYPDGYVEQDIQVTAQTTTIDNASIATSVKQIVAMVGAKPYDTLASAISMAVGNPVTLVADTTEDVIVYNALTLSANGRTITGKLTIQSTGSLNLGDADAVLKVTGLEFGGPLSNGIICLDGTTLTIGEGADLEDADIWVTVDNAEAVAATLPEGFVLVPVENREDVVRLDRVEIGVNPEAITLNYNGRSQASVSGYPEGSTFLWVAETVPVEPTQAGDFTFDRTITPLVIESGSTKDTVKFRSDATPGTWHLTVVVTNNNEQIAELPVTVIVRDVAAVVDGLEYSRAKLDQAAAYAVSSGEILNMYLNVDPDITLEPGQTLRTKGACDFETLNAGKISVKTPVGTASTAYDVNTSAVSGVNTYTVTAEEPSVVFMDGETTEYYTAKFKAAKAGTYKLLKDISRAQLAVGTTGVVLDLNGKTFTSTATGTSAAISVATTLGSASLTITGEGAIVAPNYRAVQVGKNGSAAIESGALSGKTAIVYTANGGTATISGGTFQMVSGSASSMLDCANSNLGTIAVTGGTFTGFNPANTADGDMVVEGYQSTETSTGVWTVTAVPSGIDPTDATPTTVDVDDTKTPEEQQQEADEKAEAMEVAVSSDADAAITAAADASTKTKDELTAEYQACFTKTAVKDEVSGNWVVKTDISQTTQDAVNTDASESLMEAIDNSQAEEVSVKVPAGLYYVIETYDTLGGQLIDSQEGWSAGATVPVAKPESTESGFIKVILKAAP